MKKKLFLLPITLTALTPTISMVGCGNHDDPTPDPEIEGQEIPLSLIAENEVEFTYESNEITLQKDQVYTVVADFEQLQHIDECLYLVYHLANDDEIANYITIEKLLINGNVLHEIDPENPQASWFVDGSYLAVLSDAYAREDIEDEWIKLNGKIYLTFTAKLDVLVPFKVILSNYS